MKDLIAKARANPGNRWLHSGVTANVHNREQASALRPLVCIAPWSIGLTSWYRGARWPHAKREAAFNQSVKSLRRWLGALNVGLVEGQQREVKAAPLVAAAWENECRRASHQRYEGRGRGFELSWASTAIGSSDWRSERPQRVGTASSSRKEAVAGVTGDVLRAQRLLYLVQRSFGRAHVAWPNDPFMSHSASWPATGQGPLPLHCWYSLGRVEQPQMAVHRRRVAVNERQQGVSRQSSDDQDQLFARTSHCWRIDNRSRPTLSCHSPHQKADIKTTQLWLERQESRSPCAGSNATPIRVDGCQRDASFCTHGMRERDEAGITECGYDATSN